MTASYLLIDISYTVFYRFHATKAWYKFTNPDEEFTTDYKWIENTVFKEMFQKKFFESFQFLIKKYKISWENIIALCDCPRKQIWRNYIKNDYKACRDNVNFEGGDYFKLIYDKILPDLVKNKKIKYIFKQTHLEADDLIAITKNYIQSKYPDTNIYIITGDYDLLQLIDKNTFIYNLKKKFLNEKSTGDKYTDIHLKILCGDKSDSIEGCIPKCGPKTAIKLINNKNLLKEKLKNKQILTKYIENKLIIDFQHIPQELQFIFISTLLKNNL